MIKSFSVRNFLSFKDKQTFTFESKPGDDSHKESLFTHDKTELLKSVAIYGANASGKTNFWKALLFFRQFVTSSLQISLVSENIQVFPFLLNTQTEKEPCFFEIEILNGIKRFTYGLEVSAKKIHREWLYEFPYNKQLFERNEEKIESNMNYFKEATNDLKERTRPNVPFLSVLASFNGEIASEIVREIQKVEIIAGNIYGATLQYSSKNYGKYQKKILEFLQKADFGITGLNVEENEMSSEDFLKNVPAEIRNLMPINQGKLLQTKITMSHAKYSSDGEKIADMNFDFSQESAGTQKAFEFAAPLFNTLEEGKILVVDELNAALHPFICRFILSLFNSKEENPKNAQLVFTTHDVSLLDTDILRRDQIWFTEKDEFGASKIFSLAELGERKEANYMKRYLEGRYGALPYIKSLESFD